MKRSAALLVLLGLATAEMAAAQAGPITVGEERSIESAALGESRTYLVSLPASYEDTIHAPQRYPVLFVLDAEWNFRPLSGVVDFLGAYGFAIPEMIVVGIPHMGRRVRDFTPTHSLLDEIGGEEESFEASGGADAFLRFLEEELAPEIDGRYRTRSFRVLVGHSLGGGFALHALMTRPDLASAGLVVDPSLGGEMV
jgi:predicted alpha/beta superfamily hydrolase